MTRRQAIASGLFAAVLSAAACHRPAAASHATPLSEVLPPPDACAIALAPGSTRDATDREISGAQAEGREGGARARNALERLGYLYVSRARITSDPGNYRLAEAAADCITSRFSDDPAALLLRGHVLDQLHRFHDAEQVARELTARRTMVLDYGLLGDALMEQGRLTEAADAYQKMIDIKPFYQSYVRAAHMRWLEGDLKGAIAVMRLAIASASPRDPESSAWAWTRMAAYQLQSGRLREADDAAAAALTYEPEYAAAFLAQGRIRLARGDAAGAADVFARAAKRNPVPEYQWAFADALRACGRAREAESVERELVARGGAADPRTLAVYLATRRTDVARALALAEDELHTRADIFTLDAHAWTLAAAGRTTDALGEIRRAVSAGTQDARLFLHAGVINAAAGRNAEATRWLRRAERLRSTLLPSEQAELDGRLTGSRSKRELTSNEEN
ncbi:MAG TPA: tetratricopeptide repeat protein [Vicinamibacterales bacterium]|jgi:tetratricopeptide (TPR) repeat protein|nr:tetratricopeptide repeat protein [Vicinamibacterales bacterium]